MKIAAILMILWAHTAAAATGKIKFSKRHVNFGSVYRGEQLQAKFPFQNTGTAPLKIHGVHAACGCTAVEEAKGNTYLPGESGEVIVTFDTTSFVGNISKSVSVMTNEKHLPDRTLTVQASIKSELEAVPPLVDFGDVLATEGAKKSLTIKAIGDQKFKITDVDFNDRLLEVQIVEENDVWILHVDLKPKLGPGFVKDTILVSNSSTQLPKLPIPVRANIIGNIVFAPNYLEFGAIERESYSKRSITVSGTNEFEIKKAGVELLVNGEPVKSGAELINVEVIPHEKHKRLLAIKLSNANKYSGSVHGRLLFNTSDPKQEKLAVDFYAFFK